MKFKQTLKAKVDRVEYATYLNTFILFTHVGIPLVYLFWGLI